MLVHRSVALWVLCQSVEAVWGVLVVALVVVLVVALHHYHMDQCLGYAITMDAHKLDEHH